MTDKAKEAEKDAETPKRTVKDMLNEYGNTTGFSAIFRVYFYFIKQRWIAHVFWVAISISFFSTMIYFLHKLKLSYDESPYSTKIQEISPREIPYPQIAICRWLRVGDYTDRLTSPNQFAFVNANVAAKYNISPELSYYLTTFQDDPAYLPDRTELEQKSVEEEFQKFKKSQPNSNDPNWFRDFLTEITSVPCDEFFTLNQLEEVGTPVPKEYICNGLAKPILTSREVCYVLDMKDDHNKALGQVRNGINGGLDIYINSANETFGVWMAFAFPYLPINENQMVVEKDKEIRIALSAKMTKRTKVHDNCTDTESLTHFPQYSNNACLYECLALDILKNCSCLPMGWNISNPTNARWCEPGDFYKCYQPNYLKSTPWDFKDRLRACNQQCPPRCKEWSYTKSTSVKPFLHGVVRIRVYFEDVSYQEITKVNLLTPEGILGAVGGVMGFWFGASILSLLHLFTWIVDLIYVCCKSLRSGKAEKVGDIRLE